jgi:hypothetical protein
VSAACRKSLAILWRAPQLTVHPVQHQQNAGLTVAPERQLVLVTVTVVPPAVGLQAGSQKPKAFEREPGSGVAACVNSATATQETRAKPRHALTPLELLQTYVECTTPYPPVYPARAGWGTSCGMEGDRPCPASIPRASDSGAAAVNTPPRSSFLRVWATDVRSCRCWRLPRSFHPG